MWWSTLSLNERRALEGVRKMMYPWQRGVRVLDDCRVIIEKWITHLKDWKWRPLSFITLIWLARDAYGKFVHTCQYTHTDQHTKSFFSLLLIWTCSHQQRPAALRLCHILVLILKSSHISLGSIILKKNQIAIFFPQYCNSIWIYLLGCHYLFLFFYKHNQ